MSSPAQRKLVSLPLRSGKLCKLMNIRTNFLKNIDIRKKRVIIEIEFISFLLGETHH